YTSNPFLFFTTADGPGLAYLNGFISHHGKNGCHLYCGLKGHHKEGGPHYYSALHKPRNASVPGCDHPNIDVHDVKKCSHKEYWKNLIYILLSPNETEHKWCRLETGISKPSIFLGFDPAHILEVPECFASDIMHLLLLNIPDLLIPLWCGTVKVVLERRI
ncbi:hypothetical protein BDR05DRAFT_878266, partial [Suillus weaverae]